MEHSHHSQGFPVLKTVNIFVSYSMNPGSLVQPQNRKHSIMDKNLLNHAFKVSDWHQLLCSYSSGIECCCWCSYGKFTLPATTLLGTTIVDMHVEICSSVSRII